MNFGVKIVILSFLGRSFVLGCSNFILPQDELLPTVSARTMDLGYWDGFTIEAVPKGHSFHVNASGYPPAPVTAMFGFAGVFASAPSVGIKRGVTAGINTAGLSCDMQTLIGTSYAPFPENPAETTPVNVVVFCEWALALFASTSQVKAALSTDDEDSEHSTAVPSASLYGPDIFAQHFVLRDADGVSLVVECLDGETRLHTDNNDGGETGFGVFTNEPPFMWHVENARHFDWKHTLARAAVAVPGGFYPDERFLRLHALKDGLPTPTSAKSKVMNAVALLDSVTVPPGEQPATDSGEGEGPGDHTVFAVVYERQQSAAASGAAANATLYWRSASDQSLQRLVLSDLGLDDDAGASDAPGQVLYLPVENDLPWFTDAASSFHP